MDCASPFPSPPSCMDMARTKAVRKRTMLLVSLMQQTSTDEACNTKKQKEIHNEL